MNIQATRWINDKHAVVNRVNYCGKNIVILTDDDWNIEEIIKEDDRLVITIERKIDQ